MPFLVGVIICKIRYLPPHSCWINILIQHWWALLTKGLRAYAQITSALLTEGCHASAHKTNSPSIKGLRASSDPPCLGPQDKLKGKICFGPWPLGTWFKRLISGDGFAAFSRNILTNGSMVLWWDIWNDMSSCLIHVSWSFFQWLYVFTVDVTLPLVCKLLFSRRCKTTESSTTTDGQTDRCLCEENGQNSSRVEQVSLLTTDRHLCALSECLRSHS